MFKKVFKLIGRTGAILVDKTNETREVIADSYKKNKKKKCIWCKNLYYTDDLNNTYNGKFNICFNCHYGLTECAPIVMTHAGLERPLNDDVDEKVVYKILDEIQHQKIKKPKKFDDFLKKANSKNGSNVGF
jgi:hypothetical protein